VAGYTATALAPGQHLITAVYQGDTSFAGSTTAPLLETIQQLATVTVVSSSANPSAAGAPIVLSAAVTESSGNSPGSAGGAITGAVTFLDGSTTLGTGTVSTSGFATVSVATFPLGQNNITAIYSGNANYLGSTSVVMVQRIVQGETTTTLASSAGTSTAEDAVTFTATVSGRGTRASGIVTFSSDGAVIGQGALNGQGLATLVYSGLAVGRHTLIASYAGDAQNLSSMSPQLTQIILLHPSAITLTSSATSLSGGQQVTLIAVVQGTASTVPTGTVTFRTETSSLGAATVDATGVATLTINPPSDKTTSVTASYTGDSIFSGSNSLPIAITVGLPPQFSLAASTTTVAVQYLNHMTVDLTASSQKGFTDMLTLGCLGLPKAATCTFNQNWVNLPADGVAKVHVVVDTGSPLTAGSVAKNDASASPSFVALCGLPAGLLGCLLFWKSRRRSPLGGILLLLCAFGTAAGLSGCGSIQINGTPAGTYHFQITASAQNTGVIEALDMTLKVGN
jgi:hypothetical protein